MANLVGMIEQGMERLKPRRNPYAQNTPFERPQYQVEKTSFPGTPVTNPYSGEAMKPGRERQFGGGPDVDTYAAHQQRVQSMAPSQHEEPTDPVVKTLRDLMSQKNKLETDPIVDDDSKLVNVYKSAKHAYRNAVATGDFEYSMGALAGGALRGLFKSKEDDVRERKESISKIDADIQKVYAEQDRQRKIRKEEAEIRKTESESAPKPVKWTKLDDTRIWNPETKEIVDVGQGKTDQKWEKLDEGRIWNPRTKEIVEVGPGIGTVTKIEDANIDAKTKYQKSIADNKAKRAEIQGEIDGTDKTIFNLKAANDYKRQQLAQLNQNPILNEDRISAIEKEIESNDKDWRAAEAKKPALQRKLKGIVDEPVPDERKVPKPSKVSKQNDPLGLFN